jgi:cytochrome P450
VALDPMPADVQRFASCFLTMDPPQHTVYRKLIGSAFTPRNPHLGFGGGGPHFCLGNQLTKSELRNLFRELLTRLKRVEFGEPELLHGNFVHGVKRLPAVVE